MKIDNMKTPTLITKILSVAKITATEAESKTGIAKSQFSRWKSGSVNITVETLAKIADKIGVKIEIKFKKK